jgi:hypothetical protein
MRGGNPVSEKESHESMSFQKLQEALQEAYAKLASMPKTVSVSPEEIEACLNTLNKLWQAPKASPTDLTSSALSSLAQKSITEKLDWLDERFSAAIENFENETELGLALLQARRMLREQIWLFCATSPCHERLLTFLINALDRTRPKSITKSQLNLLKENISLLAKKEITVEMLEEAEDALLTIE